MEVSVLWVLARLQAGPSLRRVRMFEPALRGAVFRRLGTCPLVSSDISTRVAAGVG
jgi:hypothetical protein